jgi:hypothetical protein
MTFFLVKMQFQHHYLPNLYRSLLYFHYSVTPILWKVGEQLGIGRTQLMPPFHLKSPGSDILRRGTFWVRKGEYNFPYEVDVVGNEKVTENKSNAAGQ